MANRAMLLAELVRLVPALTGMPAGALVAATPLDDIPGLDSLRLMDLLATAEGQHGVELDPADLENLETLDDIVTALVRASGSPQ